MNWEKIANNYPLAMEKMMIWFGWKPFWSEIRQKYLSNYDLLQIMLSNGKFHFRDLYYFFDELKIIVLIDEIFRWTIQYDLTNGDYNLEDSTELFDKRIEAEENAFDKAFEILNYKLKN